MNVCLKKILLFLLVVVELECLSQDNYCEIPNVVPPTPTAYELGKYGQIPIGFLTGTPNISIPLFDYKTKNLSLPISLSYNSNGIKVDQMETNVGLGWSLNIGGVITRIVRDEADALTGSMFCPAEDLNKAGVQSPLALEFYYDASQSDVDTEMDVFMYNTPVGSGKFVIDEKGKVLLTPHKDIKIEKCDNGFKLTNSQGIQYLFQDVETTSQFTTGADLPHQPVKVLPTAWYLSRVIHPLGDQINLSYETYHCTYANGQSQSLEVSDRIFPGECGLPPETFGDVLTHYQKIVVGKKISKIGSINPLNGIVNIVYDAIHPTHIELPIVKNISLENKVHDIVKNFEMSYLVTPYDRVFLDTVYFKDVSKFYKFEYIQPNELIGRLSYSQDHWGYYNGKSNSNLLAKTNEEIFLAYKHLMSDREPDPNFAQMGLLKKMHYPTKGHQEFLYEANSYWSRERNEIINNTPLVLLINRELENCFENGSTGCAEKKTLIVHVDQMAKIKVYVDFNKTERCISDNEHSRPVYFTITNNETGHKSPLLNKYLNHKEHDSFYERDNGIEYWVRLKAGVEYTVELRAGYFCTKGEAVIHYSDQETVFSDYKNVTVGGMRLKNMCSFDGTHPINNKRYYYGSMNELNRSSGQHWTSPNYRSSREMVRICPDPNYPLVIYNEEYTYHTLSSSSIGQVFNLGGSSTNYEYVTESLGGDNFENGGIEHRFIIHPDYSGQSVWGRGSISSAPWNNSGWRNGLEQSVKQFKKLNEKYVVLQEKTNKYVKDDRHSYSINNYHVRKNYELSTNARPVEYASNGEMLIYMDRIDNLDVIEYSTYSFWHYLQSTKSSQYDENGLNPVIIDTKYFYDNIDHIQLTKTEVVDSKGNILTTKTYYPHDLYQFDLINQNQIAVPLRIESYNNNEQLSCQETEFKDWGSNIILPEFIKSGHCNEALETRVKFLKYDAKGNLLEAAKDCGMHVVYLWGYNYSLPVAKIENATYSDVMLALGREINDDLSYLQTFGNSQLLVELGKLRTGLDDALVTSYCYTPLCGMTSQTDPNGITTYYEYDDFGRLARTKDSEGNILKKVKYNYKNK